MSDGPAERVQAAAPIFRQIQALARSNYGGNTNALLVVYAVEGFLRRLAASKYAEKMTLKGGMLMAAMSARRVTRDADLSTVSVGNEEPVIAAVVAEIVATKLDAGDGLVFDADSIRTEVMRQDAEYHGVRVKLIARLATARITTTLDFSFGDLHRSAVIELPELLGNGTIRLVSYPPEMSLAEKVATMTGRRELMEAEVTRVVGPKGKHNSDRSAKRHDHERGQVTLGGRRVQVSRPRIRIAAQSEAWRLRANAIASIAGSCAAWDTEMVSRHRSGSQVMVKNGQHSRSIETVSATSSASTSLSRSAMRRRGARSIRRAFRPACV